MDTTELPDDFVEFLRLLNEGQIEYLLVGDYAVAFHGHPRTTGDLDVWIRPTVENAEKVVRVIRKFGFDVPGLGPEPLLRKEQIVRMGLPPIRIEVMGFIDGVEFEECHAGRETAEYDDVSVPTINLADL